MIRLSGPVNGGIRLGGPAEDFETPSQYPGTILDPKVVSVTEAGEVELPVHVGPTGTYRAVAVARDT